MRFCYYAWNDTKLFFSKVLSDRIRTKNMRIICLHQYFVTPAMAGGTRTFEMARKMDENGHRLLEERYSWQADFPKLGTITVGSPPAWSFNHD